MEVIFGCSNKQKPLDAVSEATVNLVNPKLIIFFAPINTFSFFSKELSNRFPNTQIIGISTECIYCKNEVHENSLLVTSYNNDIDCSAGIIFDITRYPLKHAPEIEKNLNNLPVKENTVCFEFTTAFSYSEELVLDTFNSVCSKYNIPVVGGTAGNNLDSNTFISYVSYNGEIFKEATVYAFIHNQKGKIKLLQENIYEPTEKFFRATTVNLRKRIVNEFDGIPAATYLSSLLKCTVAELPNKLIENPVARLGKGFFYISAVGRILSDKSMTWLSRIYNSTDLCLMKIGDFRKTTKETVQTIQTDIPNPSFVFLMHSDKLFSLFKKENYLLEFLNNYSCSFPHVAGFISHGEQMNGVHFNNSLIAVIFE